MIQVELRNRSNMLVQRLDKAKNAAYHAVLNSDGVGSFLIHRTDPAVATYQMLTGGIDGFLVHLLRKGPLEAVFTDRFTFVVEAVTAGFDDQEDAGAWVQVSGRGSLSLLEDRMAFPPGYDGTNQSSITAQWQQYVTTAAGSIMTGEIDRSASRFTTVLTHTVNQATAQATVKLRFDNLRKLHDYLVTNAPMDAEMVGLDYRSYNRQGADKSAQVTVALGPQDSLLGVELERDARPVKNYVVAQGTGEGINALLRSSSDSTSIAKLRRREGFLDARESDTAGAVTAQAVGAIAQFKDPDQRITVRYFDSLKTQLYRDLFLGDTITLNAVLLGWTAPYRLVGIQVADTDQEVEDCHLDLNSMRQEYLLALQKGAALTADRLNVFNRQPQGGPYIDSQSFPDNADSTHPFRFRVYLPARMLALNYCKLSFQLMAFRADSSTSAAGSAHTHSVSGSTSGAATADHTHHWDLGGGDASLDPIGYNAGQGRPAKVSANAIQVGVSTPDTSTSHSHSVSGSTSGSEATHTHAIAFGIFESTTATGVTVKINGTDRTSALGGGSGFTTDQTELEIGQWLTIGQWNTIDLTPTNLGRLMGHIYVVGYVQSN